MRIRFTLLFSFMLLFAALPIDAQERTVFWERWDVTIDDVDTTRNQFRVTEAYDLQFSGTFQFGSVVIPLRNLDRIDQVAVYQDGRALRAACSRAAGTYCVTQQNNEISITYYFLSPITNGRESFRIEYTVYGALRIYPSGDQLWWDAIPEEHFGFSIGAAGVTVELPEGYGPREGVDPVETYGVPADVQVRGETITVTARFPIDGNDSLSVRVQYPHDPNAVPSAWQSAFDQQRAYQENVEPLVNLGLIGLSLLLGLGLPLFIYTRFAASGRDPKVGPVPRYLETPPSDLPPAIVGTLVDEKADLRDVLSTILDLGNRGYLVIEESQTQGFMGIGKTSSFVFKRTDQPITESGLRSFERRLLTNLFPGNTMERTLDSLRTVFYTVIAAMQQDLYAEMVNEGLYAVNPYARRSQWNAYGTLMLVVAFVAGWFIVAQSGGVSPFFLGLPIALGIGAVAAFIAAPSMPARTQKGAEEAAKWKAFVEYLRNLEKYATLENAAAHFQQYLAYAVMAGVDKAWIGHFQRTSTPVAVPTWYFPTYLGRYRGGYRAGSPLPRSFSASGDPGGLPGELARAGGSGFNLDDISGGIGDGLESISNGLTNMLESAGQVMTSTPQPQSSSSSGRWSSGGRSWSGGGFRSGGGSGGGSRGFG